MISCTGGVSAVWILDRPKVEPVCSTLLDHFPLQVDLTLLYRRRMTYMIQVFFLAKKSRRMDCDFIILREGELRCIQLGFSLREVCLAAKETYWMHN